MTNLIEIDFQDISVNSNRGYYTALVVLADLPPNLRPTLPEGLNEEETILEVEGELSFPPRYDGNEPISISAILKVTAPSGKSIKVIIEDFVDTKYLEERVNYLFDYDAYLSSSMQARFDYYEKGII